MDKFIKIGKDLVPVSEEVYKAYHGMRRRERYMETDIKVGRSIVDEKTGEVTYFPSKEDSIERLSSLGIEFVDDSNIEKIVCDKAMLVILQKAIDELDQEDQELIQDIHYKNLTTREIAAKKDLSQSTIVKKYKKIIEKLKKYFL